MLDLHTGEHGYNRVYAPYLVQKQALLGTGSCPSSSRICSAAPQSSPIWGPAFYLIPRRKCL